MIVMKSIVALAVLLLVVGAAFWMSRRWSWSSPGRRPHHRHWITRAICGGLGAAILFAISVSTIRDAAGSSSQGAPLRFLLPTLPAPAASRGEGPVPKGRFLLHVAVVTQIGGIGRPLHGETYEIRWPEDRNRVFGRALKFGSVSLDYSMTISGILRQEWHGKPDLYYQGHRTLNARGMSFSSGRSGGLTFPETLDVDHLGNQGGFFSIAGSTRETGGVLFDITPVREDDLLRTGTFEEFIALRGAEAWREGISSRFTGYLGRTRAHSPAEALAGELQGVLLLFLVVSLLLAQLFRRRSLGFVKVAACLLLFAGALDRVVLRIHESRMRDASAPVERRLAACAHLEATTFYRDTALRDLETTAADPAAPKELQDLASRMADRVRKYHFP